MIEGFPGLFVVIEGIDGTGKSTLASSLYSALKKRGYDVLVTFEPTYGKWGKRLRQSLSAERRMDPGMELSLFLRDRKDHLNNTIIPALKDGRIVLCDRYYYSTIAYQGARGLDTEKIKDDNKAFAVEPDIVFLLELPPEKAVERITVARGDNTDNFEALGYLKKVAAIFSNMKGECIIRLDAGRSKERLTSMALDIILERLGDKS